MITSINWHCCSVAHALQLHQPEMVDDNCSYCGSISAETLEQLLNGEMNARWIEPAPGKIVTQVELTNGQRFNLYHLWDEPLTSTDYDRIQTLLENTCGNMAVFMRKITKYHE